MSVVLLPKNVLPQKLNRSELNDYGSLVKEEVNFLFNKNENEFIFLVPSLNMYFKYMIYL